jgi:hypothetical protein
MTDPRIEAALKSIEEGDCTYEYESGMCDCGLCVYDASAPVEEEK